MRRIAETVLALAIYFVLHSGVSAQTCTNTSLKEGPDTIGSQDTRTGLIWKICDLESTGSASCKKPTILADWGDAIVEIVRLRQQTGARWRLPHATEVQGMLRSGCNPMIEQKVTKLQNNIWILPRFDSSQLSAISPIDGSIKTGARSIEFIAKNQVIPVRGGPVDYDRAFIQEAVNVCGNNPQMCGADILKSELAQIQNEVEQEKKLDRYRAAYKYVDNVAAAENFIKSYADFDPEGHVREVIERLPGLKKAETVAAELAHKKAEAERQRLESERRAEVDRKKRLEDSTRLVEQLVAAFRCEEANTFAKSKPINERPSVAFDECVSERGFRAIERSSDPQAVYIAAVRYEHDNKPERAKTLYLVLMDKFATHQIALKAADRIAALADVRAIERSNSAKEQAIREASEQADRRAAEVKRSIENANADAGSRAYQACRVEQDSCYSRGGKNCYRSCDSLR